MPITEQERELYHSRIRIGSKARRLLGSDLGQFIVRKAQDEVDAVIEMLDEVDSGDTTKIIELKIKLRTALSIPQWLTEAIEEGINSQVEYDDLVELEKEEMKVRE